MTNAYACDPLYANAYASCTRKVEAMTVADIGAAQPKDGTGGGMIAMLDFCIRQGVINQGTAKAMRTGVTKVLSIDDHPEAVDVLNMDEEDWLKRFSNLKRDEFSDGTKEAYQQRFRQARAMYLARLNGDKDWAVAGGSRSATSAPRPRTQKAPAAKRNGSGLASAPASTTEPMTTPGSNMVSYPYPVRPGLLAQISLPADLTAREAGRVAKFVASLAFDEQQAIESGVVYAEIVED